MFTDIQNKFLELKAIKELGVAFGLDSKYLDQIMSVRIEALFGKKVPKGTSPSAFFGSDEDFLSYMAKQRIIAKQPGK